MQKPYLQVLDGSVNLLDSVSEDEVLTSTLISMPWWKHAYEPITRFCWYNVPQILYLWNISIKTCINKEYIKHGLVKILLHGS